MEKETETTETSSKRLKDSDWIVVVALWERGEVTLSELSDKFGVSKAALSQGLKRRGAIRGSKAHMGHKKIADKIEEEREKLIEEIYAFKKRYVKHGETLMEMTMEILKDHKASGTLTMARNEIAAIGEASKIYKTSRDNLYHLYGLYDKDKVEEENYNFNIGVYSDSDIESLRQAQKYLDKVEEEIKDDEEEVEEDDDRVWEGIDEVNGDE